MPRFRMLNIKALFILNIEKMNFFKIRSKCITFVGIDHIAINKVMTKVVVSFLIFYFA